MIDDEVNLDNEEENNESNGKKESFYRIDLALRNEMTEELKDNTFEVSIWLIYKVMY